ncbi:MAG: HPr(Ser) kinase/phosphatase [Verrucomicrobiales bacterium]
MPEDRKRPGKPSVSPMVSVGEFYERHGKELRLHLLGSRVGLDRPIPEPTVNRPGLALADFFEYFAYRRIQVLGKSERSYLKNLTPDAQRQRFASLCKRNIPCIVVSRGEPLQRGLVDIANRYNIAVFETSMATMKFINAATVRLEWDFAPTSSEHGCMVDVMGIGIFVRGASGVGKSETVLSLISRGASLVSDDMVKFRNVEGREIVGNAPELGRCHMEVRGLGIINVALLFGVGTFRTEKRLDLVVTLKPASELPEPERLGIEKKYYPMLGLKIPHIELPVAAGRDMAQLVEVAALDQKLRSLGHDTADEFNKKLLKMMSERRTTVS